LADDVLDRRGAPGVVTLRRKALVEANPATLS
jgi:ABC-type nitrate/sulfonate/bicarbonate transport system substrate-binding protein